MCGEGEIEGGVKWRKDWNRGKGRRCNNYEWSTTFLYNEREREGVRGGGGKKERDQGLLEQCSLTGGRLSSLAMIVFLISAASSSCEREQLESHLYPSIPPHSISIHSFPPVSCL